MTSLRLTLTLTCLLLAQTECLGANCPNDQYLNGRLCCDLCPPGNSIERHCSESHATVCVPCSPGRYSEVADNLDKCRECRKCEQVTLSECSNTQNSNCSCHKGFLCISPECDVCQKEVICPRGHQLTKTGNYQYAYYCKPCPDGMYSDTEGGVCKPLQRCDQETIFPGNKTHNSKCKTQSPDPTKEPHKASVNMELTLLVILLVCVFTCLAVLVNACKSKAACMKWKQTKKPMKASPSTTVFQLSKEERGDRPIQEIDKHPSLTSLMTE
ncbi:hypothetical protein COCON_G00178740 [Conger conger]|uniref:TNFR-Cys domain-containing protein n=1 Tax=Conger conger TaxID=82655 RepID=A0A9Q1D5X9_CONCO|nr:hypothetical protein COCON_G00178740 [Conger conger]